VHGLPRGVEDGPVVFVPKLHVDAMLAGQIGNRQKHVGGCGADRAQRTDVARVELQR
jgi:hypothetical protein